MNFRPLRDHILVEPLEREHSSTLAVVTHEKHARGRVIAVGPGKRDKRGNLQPLDAKPGDIVHFGDGTKTLDNCYAKVIDGAKIYRVIQQADIAYIEVPDPCFNEIRDGKNSPAMNEIPFYAAQEKTAA